MTTHWAINEFTNLDFDVGGLQLLPSNSMRLNALSIGTASGPMIVKKFGFAIPKNVYL